MNTAASPADVRHRIRDGAHPPFAPTSGLAMGHLQGNLVILPSALALDFGTFCQRNPKPCPLIAVSDRGDPHVPTLGRDLDLRTDLPGYRIWRDGELAEEVPDIRDQWTDDLVAFVLGCSFSFEGALVRNGLALRHLTEDVCVPMYRTNLALEPAGPFHGSMVVSMRPLTRRDTIRAIEITSRFPLAHGSPVHFGDPAEIGIADIDCPDFGDVLSPRPSEIPVFWACGVTPQDVLLRSRPPFAITHKPGCMLISDLPCRDDALEMPRLPT